MATEISRRKLMFLAVSTATSGCIGMLNRVEEPFRPNMAPLLDKNKLGLVKGKTPYCRVEEAMEKYGVSGIVRAGYRDNFDNQLDFIGADYQESIFAFKEGIYQRDIALSADFQPYGIVLCAPSYNGKVSLLALYRDPSEIRESVINFYSYNNGEYGKFAKIGMESVLRGSGMSNPFMLGKKLEEGVLFMARNRTGVATGHGYLMKVNKGRFEGNTIPDLEAIDFAESLERGRGDDITRYIYGGAVPGLKPGEPMPYVPGIDFPITRTRTRLDK